MARATVRYSFNGEQTNVSGNAVRARLEEAGFSRHGTASLEALGPAADLIASIHDLLDLAAAPPGGGGLDHVWIYVDGVAEEDEEVAGDAEAVDEREDA